MDITSLWSPDEKPLERECTDGGFVGVLRTIACIGDSLSAGEFEAIVPDTRKPYYEDFFDYSSVQYLARMAGCRAHNFTRGGMTALEYMTSFAEDKGYWDPALSADAYILALGVNDLFNRKHEMGSVQDIREDWRENPKTFAGQFGAIIARYREISPGAKFFLVTIPKSPWEREDYGEKHRRLMYDIAERFDGTYVVDLRQYGPDYSTEEFQRAFFLLGHLSPAGYLLTGRLLASYIDYIIRHNFEDFRTIGYRGRDLVFS